MSSKKEYGIEEHIYETLLDLYKLECSEAFRFPVDIHLFKCPDYYQIITDPMDLSTLTTKYKDGAYKTFNEIKEQIDKIIKNCRKFNTDPNHTILKTCSKFEQCFNTRWNKLNEIRIQLGIPDDYQLRVEMNKLDSIEQRKNKKKEPASLKEDQVGRKSRLPKNESKSYNNNVQFTFKPQNEFLVNKIKIISSSIHDDDQPYIDSNTSLKNESQNLQDVQFENKNQKKEINDPAPNIFKLQIPKMPSNELSQNSEKVKLQEAPPASLNTYEPLQRQNSTQSTFSVKIQIPRLNPPQPDINKETSEQQAQNPTKSSQAIQPQATTKQMPIPIQQPTQSTLTESQNQWQSQQKITISNPQQISSQLPLQSLNQQQNIQPSQQSSSLVTQSSKQSQSQQQQPQQQNQIQIQKQQQQQQQQQQSQQQSQQQQINVDEQKIQKKVEVKKEPIEFGQQNSQISQEQQYQKPQSYDTKIMLPKQPTQQLINFSTSQTQQQKQLEKPLPISKGTTPKQEIQNTPNTPKGKRKIIDSDDSQDSDRIEQIPIIKKCSEKKIEHNETPIQLNLSGPSSEKKISNLGSHSFSLNELENKQQKENQSIKVPPTTPPIVQQPPKPEVAAPSKYVFKIDVNAIQKQENDHNLKKIEKNKKYAYKLMSILKRHIIARQPNIEILNKCLEIPSKTTLNMVLLWLKHEFDKIPFQEYVTISKFVELIYQSIQKFKCDEQPQNEQLLQQFFEKEKEQEQTRLKRIEQETKVQQEPIILEKIDLEMLFKSLRVRSKKKKVNEKEKKERDNDKQKDSDKQQQKPVFHQQQEILSFQLATTKKIKTEQKQFISIQETDEEYDLQDKGQDWWKILEMRKQQCQSMEMEQKGKDDEKNEAFFIRTLDQVKINHTLILGEKNSEKGLYSTIVVEKMFFFLLNNQSTYFKQNKILLTNFFQKLKENSTEKRNELYQQFSKYNYYVDENHVQLTDLYKIDNYAEILVKLTLKDDGDFDQFQLENKLILNLKINNLLSYTTKHNFINYSQINKQFQLKLAQYPQSISEPILLSKLYEMNDIFVESLETTKMNDNAGCGVFLWNYRKQEINQEYQYSCHLQIQVPFTFIQDLTLSINDTIILNGEKL